MILFTQAHQCLQESGDNYRLTSFVDIIQEEKEVLEAIDHVSNSITEYWNTILTLTEINSKLQHDNSALQ